MCSNAIGYQGTQYYMPYDESSATKPDFQLVFLVRKLNTQQDFFFKFRQKLSWSFSKVKQTNSIGMYAGSTMLPRLKSMVRTKSYLLLHPQRAHKKCGTWASNSNMRVHERKELYFKKEYTIENTRNLVAG